MVVPIITPNMMTMYVKGSVKYCLSHGTMILRVIGTRVKISQYIKTAPSFPYST